MGQEGNRSSYEQLRPLLFSIAYRMLGTVADAEDVVQEAFLRLERTRGAGSQVESPRGFLTTVTARLAIDELRSARARRESYFGPWLPEPLLTATEPDAAEAAQLSDSLSVSFLVVLETLTPVERAVFLLREVFEYPYDEIAQIVDKTEPNCRQILARARKRIDQGKPRFKVDRERQRELAGRFLAAFEDGELDELVSFLAADVIFSGDGGGKGQGLPRPVYGAARVGRLLRSLHARLHEAGIRLEPTSINDSPGTLNFDADGRLINVFVFEIADGLIHAVRSIINPDKLGHLGYPLSDLGRRMGPRS
ncbi:MAG TPA: RNA polymerase sigma-70 factor [Acidimicrobiales bacterium]|jgi:RNA polymerase sigma-70 factor (ECF subfamily)|nr:RNA polymerase sigma-70 factor [Acidimicrobiales bacterium]